MQRRPSRASGWNSALVRPCGVVSRGAPETPALRGANRGRGPASRCHGGSASARRRAEGVRWQLLCIRSVPRNRQGCRSASRSYSPRVFPVRGRSPLRSHRPRTQAETQPRPPSRPPRTAGPPCCRSQAPSFRAPPQRQCGSSVAGRIERPLGRIDRLAVDLEPCAATEDDVELLASLVLLVFGHQPVALVGGRPRVRPERSDTEVVAHGAHVGVLAVRDVLQFIDRRNPIAHNRPNSSQRWTIPTRRQRILFDDHQRPRSSRAFAAVGGGLADAQVTRAVAARRRATPVATRVRGAARRRWRAVPIRLRLVAPAGLGAWAAGELEHRHLRTDGATTDEDGRRRRCNALGQRREG